MKKNQTVSPINTKLNPKKKKRRQSLIALIVFLIVMLGLSAAFLLQGRNQDNRNQASVADGLVYYTLVPQTYQDLKNVRVDLFVNTQQANVDALQLQLELPSEKVTALSFISEDIPELKEIKNTVENGKITAAWILQDMEKAFQSSGNIKLGTIYFIANTDVEDNNIAFNWDPSFSKATLYKTGEDSLRTPDSFNFYPKEYLEIQNPISVEINCQTDADCPKNLTCYQPPMPECPEGQMCAQLMPSKICTDINLISETPTPTPTNSYQEISPTAQPLCQSDADCKLGEVCAVTPPGGCPKKVDENGVFVITACAHPPTCTQAADINCQTDDDCYDGYSCYQPPMPECPAGQVCSQAMPQKVCKDMSLIVKTPTPTPTYREIPSVTPEEFPGVICSAPKPCDPGYRQSIVYTDNGCNTYLCEKICEPQYSEWTPCEYGVQRRTITNFGGEECPTGNVELVRECTVKCNDDTQCSKFEYCSKAGVCVTREQEVNVADINLDGQINVLDLSQLLLSLYTDDERSDLNQDQLIDISDYSLMIKAILDSSKMRTFKVIDGGRPQVQYEYETSIGRLIEE